MLLYLQIIFVLAAFLEAIYIGYNCFCLLYL